MWRCGPISESEATAGEPPKDRAYSSDIRKNEQVICVERNHGFRLTSFRKAPPVHKYRRGGIVAWLEWSEQMLLSSIDNGPLRAAAPGGQSAGRTGDSRDGSDLPQAGTSLTKVKIIPSDIVRRRYAGWTGIQGETIEITRLQHFEFEVRSPFHVLIMAERGELEDGETIVDGFGKSTQRDCSRKLSFIPAGHFFHGWQDPRVLTRCTYLYIDPAGPQLEPALHFSEIDFKPKLHFFDDALWETVSKLKTQIENPGAQGYSEALSVVLAYELVRVHRGAAALPVSRGGLAGWQKKRVAEYIEDHLNEDVSLQDLADIVQLSRCHFARAFKQSFGQPPHRYHMSCRMERAKALLQVPARTVTEIGVSLGFAETSSFSTSFHRSVGKTPSEYRRGLNSVNTCPSDCVISLSGSL
jgi:AraC-like DNA-binding protein